ncbi:hypothetical protein C8Q80DRAFT_464461 [Daedaleopsis nitida]|nr:hypothetical protein C8Q80DRAFT_464461 [Daedaleopsis nitida]
MVDTTRTGNEEVAMPGLEKATLISSPSTAPTPLAGEGLDGQGLTFIVELKTGDDNTGLKEADGRIEPKHDVVSGERPHVVQDPPTRTLPSIAIDISTTTDPCLSDSDSQRSPALEPPGLSSVELAIKHEEPTAVEGRASPGPPPPEEAATEGVADVIANIDPAVFHCDLSDYSLSDLPTLDRVIPDDLLPDDLLVYDVDNLTNPAADHSSQDQQKSDNPVRYVRILPKALPEHANAYAGRDPARPVQTAHLYLQRRNKLGSGHHSEVYRAPFSLPLDPESQERSVVSVTVKTAHTKCGAHFMLNQEAETYDALPRSYMQDTYPPRPSPDLASVAAKPEDAMETDPQSAPPELDADLANCALPAPPAPVPAEGAAATGSTTGPEPEPEPEHDADPEPAVVPKFYGYYAKVAPDGTLQNDSHGGYHCDEDGTCTVKWPTRILLLEECGVPVDPYFLPREHREKCRSLIERLHEAGVAHLSTYVRNMLVQCGPLSVPPAERSMSTPSFRIIDFGRAQRRDKVRQSEFKRYRSCDLDLSYRELRLKMMDGLPA